MGCGVPSLNGHVPAGMGPGSTISLACMQHPPHLAQLLNGRVRDQGMPDERTFQHLQGAVSGQILDFMGTSEIISLQWACPCLHICPRLPSLLGRLLPTRRLEVMNRESPSPGWRSALFRGAVCRSASKSTPRKQIMVMVPVFSRPHIEISKKVYFRT